MSARAKKNQEETVEEVRSDAENMAAVSELSDEEKNRRQDEKIKAFLSKLPDPCVYCGPSVRNVARQYTVYQGGIPDALKEFIMEHKTARGLLVSAERFAQVRTRLETPGTAESILFNKVRASL